MIFFSFFLSSSDRSKVLCKSSNIQANNLNLKFKASHVQDTSVLVFVIKTTDKRSLVLKSLQLSDILPMVSDANCQKWIKLDSDVEIELSVMIEEDNSEKKNNKFHGLLSLNSFKRKSKHKSIKDF